MHGKQQKDGLYRVRWKNVCAGFVVKNGCVVQYAPILRRKMDWWRTIAVWISP